MRRKYGEILVEDFWWKPPFALYESELGWAAMAEGDVPSDNPETIFRYYVDTVGLNVAFFYVDDGCFYSIFTEQLPIEVRRKPKDPAWDGVHLIDSVVGGVDTCGPGEVIYATNDASSLWNELRIGGKAIGEVLARSVILTLD